MTCSERTKRKLTVGERDEVAERWKNWGIK